MDDALLAAIAERFGTPTYVYDLDHVARRLTGLRAALPGASVLYAVKANPNGAVLRRLAALGAGAEVITLGELERAARAGIPGERMLVGGPAQGDGMLARAAALGVGLASLDSPGQWDAWERVLETHPGLVTRFVVRLNPGLDPGTHEHLATGAADAKFGLGAAPARRLAGAVARRGRLAGFHVHAGSMIRDVSVYDAIFEAVAPLYADLAGLPLFDLGGGFAVPGFPLERFAERVRGLAAALGVALVLEPGRYLTGDAGTLLTRVLHVKADGPRTHVVADAGMAELLRPALYGAVHPVRLLDGFPGAPPGNGAAAPGPGGGPSAGPGRAAARVPLDVDGPLCENGDRLGRDVSPQGVPPDRVRPGSLLAVEQAGAYGFAMASNYASSLRPAEVVVEGGRPRLARRREAVEDLWRLEVDEADGG